MTSNLPPQSRHCWTDHLVARPAQLQTETQLYTGVSLCLETRAGGGTDETIRHDQEHVLGVVRSEGGVGTIRSRNSRGSPSVSRSQHSREFRGTTPASSSDGPFLRPVADETLSVVRHALLGGALGSKPARPGEEQHVHR